MPPSSLMPPAPSKLLADAAEFILRRRLKEVITVDVSVDAEPAQMLGGAVQGVNIRGNGWCTPLRLSCRSLDLSVGETAIDFAALLSKQQILLKRPALGSADISFSAEDWGCFLVHPRLKDWLAERREATGAPAITFVRAKTRILPSGAVEFPVKWDGAEMRAELSQRQDGSVLVEARPWRATDDTSQELLDAAGAWLADFFATLTVDLDGCELRFRRLSASAPAADTPALLDLALDVRVRSFPSLEINF